jgi:hypothetical protein
MNSSGVTAIDSATTATSSLAVLRIENLLL